MSNLSNIDKLNAIIDDSIKSFIEYAKEIANLEAINNIPRMEKMSRLLFLCLEDYAPTINTTHTEIIDFLKNNNISNIKTNKFDDTNKILDFVKNNNVFKKISFISEYTGYFEEPTPTTPQVSARAHEFKIDNVYTAAQVQAQGQAQGQDKKPLYTIIENTNYLYVKYIVSLVITLALNGIDIGFINVYIKYFIHATTQSNETNNILVFLNKCESQLNSVTKSTQLNIKRYLLEKNKMFEEICGVLISNSIDANTILDIYNNPSQIANANGGAIDISNLSNRMMLKRPKMKHRKKSYKLVKDIGTRKVKSPYHDI